jgi:hypothetical protein
MNIPKYVGLYRKDLELKNYSQNIAKNLQHENKI